MNHKFVKYCIADFQTQEICWMYTPQERDTYVKVSQLSSWRLTPLWCDIADCLTKKYKTHLNHTNSKIQISMTPMCLFSFAGGTFRWYKRSALNTKANWPQRLAPKTTYRCSYRHSESPSARAPHLPMKSCSLIQLVWSAGLNVGVRQASTDTISEPNIGIILDTWYPKTLDVSAMTSLPQARRTFFLPWADSARTAGSWGLGIACQLLMNI